MLLNLVCGHKLANSLFCRLVLNTCLQIGNETFAAHITDNLLGCIESTFVLIVFKQVLEDTPQHFRVNANFCVIRVVLVDGEVVGGKEIEQRFHVFFRQWKVCAICGFLFKQTAIQIGSAILLQILFIF